jgi:hypothetical protein
MARFAITSAGVTYGERRAVVHVGELECTQHRWHALGDGSLCLFQTETAGDPGDSICDLIIKAAAWRVEYALVKSGAMAAMTLNGIVSDSGQGRSD